MKILAPQYTKIFLACLLSAVLHLSPVDVFAENTPPQPQHTANRLRQHLNGLSSLTFQFTQLTKGQLSGRPRQASGQAFFFKDATGTKMRWNYAAPDVQVIISDGATLSMYFEQTKQMIITPAETLQQDVTYSFFAGNTAIEDDFIIEPGLEGLELESVPSGIEVITLTPRMPSSQVKNIRLWVTSATQIQRIEILDNFDTVTLLNLSNIEENSLVNDGKLVDSGFFTFTPPQGTELIHQ